VRPSHHGARTEGDKVTRSLTVLAYCIHRGSERGDRKPAPKTEFPVCADPTLLADETTAYPQKCSPELGVVAKTPPRALPLLPLPLCFDVLFARVFLEPAALPEEPQVVITK
jgi:hypothetical protein